jgi:hypothetical protein
LPPLDYAKPHANTTTTACSATIIPPDDASLAANDLPSPSTQALPAALVSEDDLLTTSSAPLSKWVLASLNDDHNMLPEIPPPYTPVPAEPKQPLMLLNFTKKIAANESKTNLI